MYPSDLTKSEWKKIRHFFKRPDPRGNKGKHKKRVIVNAILYVIKGGIPWRMLPNDLPPWKTVYDRFSRWNKAGTWKKAVFYLNKHVREKEGKEKNPTYGIVDSQSAKTIYNSEKRGFDGGKKN